MMRVAVFTEYIVFMMRVAVFTEYIVFMMRVAVFTEYIVHCIYDDSGTVMNTFDLFCNFQKLVVYLVWLSG
jgi:hypothetical protein